jgi:hypothetical protein
LSSLGSTTRTVPGQNMTRPPPHPLSEHGGEGKIEVKTKMEVGKMEVKIEVKMAVKMEVKMGKSWTRAHVREQRGVCPQMGGLRF